MPAPGIIFRVIWSPRIRSEVADITEIGCRLFGSASDMGNDGHKETSRPLTQKHREIKLTMAIESTGTGAAILPIVKP